MVTVILIAGGEMTRWGNYLGVPKHFAEIDGEPVIKRTVRLLQKYHANVIVVAKDMRYKIDGSALFIPIFNTKNFDADKFLNSKILWNKQDRTVVLYGDVYFTEEALDTIMTYPKRSWTLFCRPHGSEITGSDSGECFAQSFYPVDIDKHEKALYRIAQLKRTNTIDRCGGWEHYRAMLGRSDEEIREPHIMGDMYVEINDFTEDLDYPHDYDRLIEKLNQNRYN